MDDRTSTVLFQLLTASAKRREQAHAEAYVRRHMESACGRSDLLLAMLFFALAGVAGLALMVIIMDLL